MINIIIPKIHKILIYITFIIYVFYKNKEECDKIMNYAIDFYDVIMINQFCN